MRKSDKEEIRLILIDTIGSLEKLREGKEELDIIISSVRSKIKELL